MKPLLFKNAMSAASGGQRAHEVARFDVPFVHASAGADHAAILCANAQGLRERFRGEPLRRSMRLRILHAQKYITPPR
ncbi:hypothetical protein [Burkholderia dolosa]|uniref:hypothetical protein n=1 Tax=Burkholderia dolosa TaxID=152500 RepID=UPI0015917F7A|nr:hypothetical protein [Burkholderia dolosa]MBY4755332.1 hypothetical protein [Burkholderia dolosa]